MFSFPKPLINISIIWQRAPEWGPLKIDSTLFKISLLNWSVLVFEEIVEHDKMWIVFCGTFNVGLANVLEITLLTVVDFGGFIVAVDKCGSRLRTFLVMHFSLHNLF